MSQPDMARVKSVHPDFFDITGNLRETADIKERIIAIKTIINTATKDLEKLETKVKTKAKIKAKK